MLDNVITKEVKFLLSSKNYSVLNILKDIKDKCNSQIVTVETNGNRDISFYQNKLEFNDIGKKIRFFKNMNIYKRDF